MLPYWILFSASSLLALVSWPWRGTLGAISATLIGLALVIFIGFRFEVGADWSNYEVIFLDVGHASFPDALLIGDPGYSLLNWVVAAFGGDIWFVNLFCAALFVYALLRLCMTLPLPWVAFLAAVPALIIIVSMGYTRQASALAFVMLAIRAYDGGFNWRWLFWLAVGVTFHKSTILMFPIFALAASRNRTVVLASGAAIGMFLLFMFILQGLQDMIEMYFGSEMQSSGAFQRAGLAVIPAILFFAIPNMSQWFGYRYKIWRNMAITSLLLVPMLLVLSSSTVVDRIGVLLLPFQIAFYSAIPMALSQKRIWREVLVVGIILFSAAIQTIWLLYADNSSHWIPYRNVLTEPYVL